MALYEQRTYTIYVGHMNDVIGLYTSAGWPALEKYKDKLVGYFTGDIGGMNQLVHLWRFDDDADRRQHWKNLFADPAFIDDFAAKFRPLVQTQEVKLLHAAPWGHHP